MESGFMSKVAQTAARVLPKHIEQLEAEAIHILRETAAEFERPVLLYSIGKDSGALLHLAVKAFRPAKMPFALLHVDTTWKFREMIEFRDATMSSLGLDLIVHINEDGVRRGINPIDSGSVDAHPRHEDGRAAAGARSS
jgi:sulfate adenylyltransferase subunit 2